MSTDIQAPVTASTSSSVLSGTNAKQDKKGKGKLRIEDKRDTDGNESEASVGESRRKAKAKTAKRIERKGTEEVQSDTSPDNDEESAAVDESELSSHSESERDASADEKTRTARRGEKNAAKKARREWRGLYRLLSHQWKEGGRAELSGSKVEIFKQANQRIERYCDKILNADVAFNTKAEALYRVRLKKLEEDLIRKPESHKMQRRKALHTHCIKEARRPSREDLLKKWKFPNDELCAQIYAIEIGLKELDELPSGEAYNKKIADYEQRLAASQPGSKEYTNLTNKKTHKQKSLAIRRQKTEKLLQTALICLDNLEGKGIPPSQVLTDRTNSVFQDFFSLSRENTELFNALKADMERPTLEQLDKWDVATKPMCDFASCVSDEAMSTEQNIVRAGNLIKDLERIDKHIEVLGETKGKNCLPMSILCEMLEQYKSAHYEQVQLNVTRLIEQLRRHEAAVDVVRAIEFGESLSGPVTDPEDAANAGIEAASKPTVRAAANGTSAAATNPVAGVSLVAGTDLSDEYLRNIDITSLELGSNIAEVFQYENGMTEHGPLVATRLWTTENAGQNRYIVNAGLDKPGMEYLKVFRGSDLGPGGAEQLADQNVVDFDLKQHNKDVSQWVQLAGKFGEKHFSVLEAAYIKTQLYFEACKVQKLHLETKQPLTADDLRGRPWLFPETDQNISSKGSTSGSVETEDDDDEDVTNGVTVDAGAFSANTTDPFKKPRANLANITQASSSPGNL
ncbi:hypothetical protein BU25DRAFT_477072 [Macroventuria anomochaeta]|uniref:Uncharacterized protein n=1 Tax=Macroventuria anomochaeta TaxID=301207 RepID=A0ACB6RSU0_9PLEO|nr:uncharacterized protein BU25DRAFT_477072 [Macroventuria anomochaeta]KAF2623977.1 hypothetical protein BU25DRAFT_477072 [Macroventuria anomochaeta]